MRYLCLIYSTSTFVKCSVNFFHVAKTQIDSVGLLQLYFVLHYISLITLTSRFFKNISIFKSILKSLVHNDRKWNTYLI